MTRIAWRASAYGSMIGAGARVLLAYRANYLLRILNVLIQVFVLTMVWTSVYAGRAEVDGVDLPTMLAYVTVISVQSWWFGTATFSMLPLRVRGGQVAFDLIRPLGLVGQVFPRQIGATLAMAPFALLALPLAGLIGELRGPAGPGAAAAYAVSLVLAFVVGTLAGTLIGLTAFWTFETRALQFVYSTIAQFFAGTMVPLWFMPGWLRTIGQLLPFQAVGYTPVSVYLGRLRGGALAEALAVQAFWVIVLALAAMLIWRRAIHRVVIQGG